MENGKLTWISINLTFTSHFEGYKYFGESFNRPSTTLEVFYSFFFFCFIPKENSLKENNLGDKCRNIYGNILIDLIRDIFHSNLDHNSCFQMLEYRITATLVYISLSNVNINFTCWAIKLTDLDYFLRFILQ